MSRSPTKVQFTVGKLDAGMAILLTQDHHQIEFPSILLPRTVTTGSIIDLSVTQNPEQEARVNNHFLALQTTIREAFAAKSPATPVLSLRNATQTSAVLEWEPIDIATAELKSLTLWRDGSRLGNIPKPLSTTTTKLSGLAIDTEYTFQLVLRTTAGTYPSLPLKIKTHKLSNLSGISVCAGTLPPEQHSRLLTTLETIGAKPLQKRVRIDTTHFICSVPEGEEFQRAREMNVPIVLVDWIEACRDEGKIVGVRGYYLDADPALRPKGTPRQSRAIVREPPQQGPPHDGSSRDDVPEIPKEPVKETEVAVPVHVENEKVALTPVPEETATVPAPETAPVPVETSEEVEVPEVPKEVPTTHQEGERTITAEDSVEKFDDVVL